MALHRNKQAQNQPTTQIPKHKIPKYESTKTNRPVTQTKPPATKFWWPTKQATNRSCFKKCFICHQWNAGFLIRLSLHCVGIYSDYLPSCLFYGNLVGSIAELLPRPSDASVAKRGWLSHKECPTNPVSLLKPSSPVYCPWCPTRSYRLWFYRHVMCSPHRPNMGGRHPTKTWKRDW